MRFRNHNGWLRFTALICVGVVAPGGIPLLAQGQQPRRGPGGARS